MGSVINAKPNTISLKLRQLGKKNKGTCGVNTNKYNLTSDTGQMLKMDTDIGGIRARLSILMTSLNRLAVTPWLYVITVIIFI